MQENFKDMTWECATRIDLVSDIELLQLMYSAGCRQISIGVESLNNKNLIHTTIDEYAKLFNVNSAINKDNYHLKIFEVTDELVEYCPHCGYEVVLKSEFKKQNCPICNKEILPCSICDSKNCSNCPLNNLK